MLGTTSLELDFRQAECIKMLGRRGGAEGKGSGVKEEMLWMTEGKGGGECDITSPCLSFSLFLALCSTSCRGDVHTCLALRRPPPPAAPSLMKGGRTAAKGAVKEENKNPPNPLHILSG